MDNLEDENDVKKKEQLSLDTTIPDCKLKVLNLEKEQNSLVEVVEENKKKLSKFEKKKTIWRNSLMQKFRKQKIQQN